MGPMTEEWSPSDRRGGCGIDLVKNEISLKNE